MLKTAKKILHEISHKLGANTGVVDVWWEGTKPERMLMVGFRCDKCGRLSDVHESLTTRLMREERNK